MPDIIDVAIAFAHANLTEPVLRQKRAAGCVGCNHLTLQGPVLRCFGNTDQRCEQGGANPLPLCRFGDIDADLSDPGCASGVGHG